MSDNSPQHIVFGAVAGVIGRYSTEKQAHECAQFRKDRGMDARVFEVKPSDAAFGRGSRR
jgi:hypothetical protein